ncbi:hypothetical protein Bpfe_021098 [Biomphalaria pfeifferi]|uniref:Uncharacterized protein n=1 Tax=Biomphalaria pfeifferi TaxID=112525 RepID=A0AAD8F3W4_BIOPF|nr:hypothetical protein Bpfe_021098 [Biomphalaria pfeifferi]
MAEESYLLFKKSWQKIVTCFSRSHGRRKLLAFQELMAEDSYSLFKNSWQKITTHQNGDALHTNSYKGFQFVSEHSGLTIYLSAQKYSQALSLPLDNRSGSSPLTLQRQPAHISEL